MHRYSISILAVLLLAFPPNAATRLLLSPNQSSIVINKGVQNEKPKTPKSFEKARELLINEGLPFEPNLLLGRQWKRTLRPIFDQMSELRAIKQGDKHLKGVHIAGTLYLPEKVSLEDDTVILVRHLVFSGREVVIKGNHSIHIFTIQGTELTGNASSSILSPTTKVLGHITIDTSGFGRDQWLEKLKSQQIVERVGAIESKKANHVRSAMVQTTDHNGQPGADGTPGADGAPGQNGNNGTGGANGSCTSNINGADADGGGEGAFGGDGGTGGNGNNGGNATPISITAEVGQSYTLLANGGRGGDGEIGRA